MESIVIKCMEDYVNENSLKAAKEYMEFLQRNQERVQQTISYPIEAFSSIEWCEEKLKSRLKGPFNFMIFNKEDNDFIGICGALGKIDNKTEIVELGYLIGEKYEGKGIVTTLLKQVICKLFNEVESIKKLEICTFENNEKSKNVAKRLRFKLNENHEKMEKLWDLNGLLLHLFVYELTREEFLLQKDSFNFCDLKQVI
ncbi:hypothetical protein ABK040_001069 [Willaertia magna]